MRQNVIVVLVVAAVLGLFFLARGTVEVVWAMAMTACDLYSPPPQPTPPAAPAQEGALRQPLSGFAAQFSNHLMTMGDDGKAHPFDTHSLTNVRYFAFYYSASWCGPCRQFTPDLVNFYRDFKPKHPDFELIFVNLDDSEDAMESYMRNDAMPWPAVWNADVGDSELAAKKYCGSGIPDLVLVNAGGDVLSDTFQNGQYTDPHHVIDDIRSMVP